MRLLWLATKPPWPPVDGGRVVVRETLAALAERGHEIELVAPYDPRREDAREAERRLAGVARAHLVPVSRTARWARTVAAIPRGEALAIARHSHAAVRRVVAARLESARFDVVHAEQVQALANCAPAFARGTPVVLRCENVESDLWHARALARAGGPVATWRVHEERRLARAEAEAVRRAAAVVALTADDALRLTALAGGATRVEHVPAPFPAALPAGQPLAGDPAVVVLGSAGWHPNRDGFAWFLDAVWPRLHHALPGATLHAFGASAAASRTGVVVHPPPRDASVAFAEGALLVVPLRYGSGVRVRILEAWARGIAVVATPAAAAGLDARDGRELVVAGDPEELVRAVRALHADRDRQSALIAAGRARLAAAHEPAAIAARLESIYARCRAATSPP
jgi:glycosyltransferase involved in cell wall biosynthesis